MIFQAAPLFAGQVARVPAGSPPLSQAALQLHDPRVTPHYPSRSPLEDVLRLVRPGVDEYLTEQYAAELKGLLAQWSNGFVTRNLGALLGSLGPAFQATPLATGQDSGVRTDGAIRVIRRVFPQDAHIGSDRFANDLKAWLGSDTTIERADFEIVSIQETKQIPPNVKVEVRYEVLTSSKAVHRTHRLGSWRMNWERQSSDRDQARWKLLLLHAESETISSVTSPVFVDVSQTAFKAANSFEKQFLHSTDYWRSVLDGACGIDVYGNNGIAAGDFDNDGFDDLYISQPAGLPNRLYRNLGNGTFEDVTDKAGVGVLDNTSCALFADLRNVGLQDLLVVCGNGPLLFVNQGDGTFRMERDAFKFAETPQGTFTHAAIADFDGDGQLDVYFCVYSYYLGLDQYHYPVPYFDARNGPPNFLFRNQGNAVFIDATAASGLNVDNDRYSFACAWGQSSAGGHPDLYVVNDFGRNVLYRNEGNGTFTVTSGTAQVEDVGAGMSACWADTTNNGRSDLYVANMWSAAGQRVSEQAAFHSGSTPKVRKLYQRHADGNALYLNQGKGGFRHAAERVGVDAGRWAWCSDSWDFDHDGFADMYVTNGYITAPKSKAAGSTDTDFDQPDLGSFFWRQVVGKSPDDSTPSIAYEHGWNAINELIRSDHSWSGGERNVMYANNRDGTFSDVSSVTGLDSLEDGRSFALADFNGDGRLEVALKNRNAPQLRLLHNSMEDIADSLIIRLRGTVSNRDAIGASVTVEVGESRQTKWLQAGSGFLAQHSKELSFGLGKVPGEIRATIHWPGGLTQQFMGLPRNNRISFIEGRESFSKQPFKAAGNGYPLSVSRLPAVQEPPSSIQTWLLDPLKAPDFSLNDIHNQAVSLRALRGNFTMLHFCSLVPGQTSDVLLKLKQGAPSFQAHNVNVLVLLVDAAGTATNRSFATGLPTALRVAIASEEVMGIYNIVYRYLFDRRRDLPLPCAFLLDPGGMIVKCYQGAANVATVIGDLQSVPANPSERLQKGLPFAGKVQQSDFLRNDFTYGVAMFQHGYLDQAEASFEQVVSTHPNNAEGYYNLGTLNLRKRKFDQARTYLRKSLKLKADYPEAWNNLGMMAAQEGNTVDAIQNFKKSLELRPDYAIALLNLGNAYRRQGDKLLAKEALTKALSLQPDDADIQYSLGLFHAQLGELRPAEDYLRQAISLRPDFAEAMNNLGVLLVQKQDYEKAAAEFKECIRKAPDFDQGYLNLARLYVVQHNPSDARAILRKLLVKKPENVSAQKAIQALETLP